MLLLTWHGTILRVEQAQNRLCHTPLVPERSLARDFRVDFPWPLTAPARLGAGLEVVPGHDTGTVHVRQGDLYMSVDASVPFPLCDRAALDDTCTLLPLSGEETALLRLLLAAHWQSVAGCGPAAPPSVTLQPGFKLAIGAAIADLTSHRPFMRPDGTLVLDLPGSSIELAMAAPPPPRAEWHLRPALGPRRCVLAATQAAFQETPNTRLFINGADEHSPLPMAASRADLDSLYAPPVILPRPGSPTARFDSDILHETDSCVFLEPPLTGMVFGPHGVSTPHLPAAFGENLPAGFSREIGEILLHETVALNAPMLQGPHYVLCSREDPGAHWLIDTIPALCLAVPYLPSGTTLIIPAHLAGESCRCRYGYDAVELLEAADFGFMPRRVQAGQLCRVATLFWVYPDAPSQLPATVLDGARRRILPLPPAAGERKRLYLKPSGVCQLANAAETEAVFLELGFEAVHLPSLRLAGQIALLRQADFIAGVRGPDLANVILCSAGTRVIEIAPAAYDPACTWLAGKLGLPHGILPCAADEGDGPAKLIVPAGRLRALIRLLASRL